MSSDPPVTRLGTAVLLQSTAVRDVAFLIRVGIREIARRDGISAHQRWLHLQRQLDEAAGNTRIAAESADDGNGQLPIPEVAEELDPEVLINTEEAALMLGLKARQVRNLATRLGARRAGRALVFDRGLIQAEARHRHQIGTN